MSRLYTFSAPVTLGDDGGITGTAYSGGVIEDHPQLQNVVIDIATTKFGATLPMLKNHNPAIEIAAIELSSDGREITYAGDFLDSPEANQIRLNASDVGRKGKRKFPYAASVGIKTKVVRMLKAGATETLNGRQITGPATIFQNNTIREVSLTPVAADQNNPAAHIFTATPNQPQEVKPVSEQNTPPGVTEAQLTALQNAIEAKFTAQLAAKDEQLQKLSDALAATAVKERTNAITALFSTVGIEAKAESIAPYLTLSDEQFAAVSLDMTNVAKAKRVAPASNVSLFSATQLPGTENPTPKSGVDILKAAQTYQFSQKQAGNEVELSDAIRIVSKES